MTFLLKYLSVLLGEFLHDGFLRGGALPHVPHLMVMLVMLVRTVVVRMLVMLVMMVMVMMTVVRMLVMMMVSSAGEPSHMCLTSQSHGLFGLILRMFPAYIITI